MWRCRPYFRGFPVNRFPNEMCQTLRSPAEHTLSRNHSLRQRVHNPVPLQLIHPSLLLPSQLLVSSHFSPYHTYLLNIGLTSSLSYEIKHHHATTPLRHSPCYDLGLQLCRRLLVDPVSGPCYLAQGVPVYFDAVVDMPCSDPVANLLS